MKDILIILILITIFALASFYIYKEKKSGKKCIGCPDSAHCNGCSCKSSCTNK